MTWSSKKFFLGATLSLAILIAAFAAGLLPLNLFFLKNKITEAIRDRTGAELVVEGPLRLQLGWKPRLTARSVTLQWPDEDLPLAASVAELVVQTRMPSVWRGTFDLQSLIAREIILDSVPGGFDAWLPGPLYLEATAPVGGKTSLLLRGRVRGENWTVRLAGASLDELRSATRDYPLTARLDLNGSNLAFDGFVPVPWNNEGIRGQLDIHSKDLSSLLLHLGQEMPGLGRLSLRSAIAWNESRIELDHVDGRLDDFSFTSSALVRQWSARPRFDVTARIPLIDPASLPGVSRVEGQSAAEVSLDLQPVFDRIAAFDGRADLTVDEIRLGDSSIEGLGVIANLEKGLLTIENAGASFASIEWTAQASLDTSAACARLKTVLRIPETKLSALGELWENKAGLDGSLQNGVLRTSSCGSSPRQHVQSVEAEFTVDSLTLSGSEGQPPIDVREIDAAINQRKAGRVSLASELMGEALTVSAVFGSIEQMMSDELWPIALDARTGSMALELSGQTALFETGMILDLELAARTGHSDISGELAWGGPGSGLPLKANLHSSLLDLRDFTRLLPAEGAADETGKAGPIRNGSGSPGEAQLFSLLHAFPSVDVKVAIEQLEGTSYDIGSLGLDARIEDGQLKDGRMRLGFEGVDMQGRLDADLKDRPFQFDYRVTMKNLDVGRLMRAMKYSDTVDARVEQADIHIETHGERLSELLGNTSVDAALTSLQWSFGAGPGDRPFEINLSEVNLHAARGADTIWETHGTLNGFPLNARLHAPNLRDALDAKARLPLRFTVASRDEITMLDLVVHPETKGPRRCDVRVSGRYSTDERVDLSALPSPLEDYLFSADLFFSENEYLASDIDLRVGASQATGSFGIRRSSEGFLFRLDARSPFFETDDLVRWVEVYREAREFMSAPEAADPDEAPVPVGLLDLINQFLDDFIGSNTWDVRLHVAELRSGGRLLGETNIGLHMDERTFVLKPATITLPGGDVSIEYRGSKVSSGWDYDLDFFIESLEYGGLLRLYDPASTAEGVMYLDTELRSRTQHPRDFLNQLEGTVDLAVFPENTGARFLDLWASNLVFALLPLGDNQQKKLNCMVARFEVENGVMTSKNTFLDSTEIIVRARGEIDLANRELDLLAVPQAKREKFLSISTPIQATGPFDDFSVGLVRGSVIMTLIRWYYGLIYVPWKWITGERFPADGLATCYNAMDWEAPTEAR